MAKKQAALAALIGALLLCAWRVQPASSGEWAAWVQTLGVLLAIGWSVYLQSQAQNQGARQASQVASVYASNMHWVFRELNDACAKESWLDYQVNRRILQEILVQGREVPLQLLDGRALAMVSSLRAIGVEALELTEGHHVTGNWRQLHVYFDRRLPNIAAWMSATGHPPESSGPTDYAGLRTSFGQLGGL